MSDTTENPNTDQSGTGTTAAATDTVVTHDTVAPASDAAEGTVATDADTPSEADTVQTPAETPVTQAKVEPVIIDTSVPATTVSTAPFGRVDSHGYVFVIKPDGTEAQVGQHLAGTPIQALEHYQHKYEDLKLRAELILRRLREKSAKPADATAVTKELAGCLETPTCVGDLAIFSTLVESLKTSSAERAEELRIAREAAAAEALQARTHLVIQAESLAESTAWRQTTEKFKELLDEWKRAGRAGRDAEQELWLRFSAARKAFDKRRKVHFAERDEQRDQALQIKNLLIKEAEALSTSTDWVATARAYTALMNRWKAAPKARTGEENALWARFRAAQDTFFTARSKALDARDEEFKGNLEAKEALADEAVALLPVTAENVSKVKQALRTIQDKWEKIGHVPRGDKDRVEGKLRSVEEAVRNHEREQWRRSNPEARDRANGVVEQFRTALAKLDADIAAAKDGKAKTDLTKRRETTAQLLDAAEKAAAEYV